MNFSFHEVSNVYSKVIILHVFAKRDDLFLIILHSKSLLASFTVMCCEVVYLVFQNPHNFKDFEMVE